jgi:predicted PurR-regulated permease PerM
MVVWFNRRQALAVVLALLTLAVGYAGLKIVAPFVAPLTWSVTLAAIAQPLYRWLTRSLRRPWIAAALTSFIIVSALALPATYAITQMTQQALDAAQTLRDSVSDGGWKNIVKPDSPFRPATEWIDEQAQRGGYRDQLINALAGAAKYAASASLYIATDALITIFFLFFFLRDGPELLAGIRHLLPLSRDEANEVLGRVHGMITAIIYGTLVVALIQGFLGGVAFWWLGLPAPALWGAVMALASILPTVGTALVWAPTALYLALIGDLSSAAILVAWGAIVIGLVDNLLKPLLMNRRIHVHTVLVFIAVLGGLLAFGAIGVVLGPIILAVIIGLIDVWQRRFDVSEGRR